VTRPRAADDFATIRARMEELRRERAPAPAKEAPEPADTAPGGRALLRGTDARQRADAERWATGSLARRPGSGR
jgi:hypothetical protein